MPLDAGYQFLLDMECRHVFTKTVPAKVGQPAPRDLAGKRNSEEKRRSVPLERKENRMQTVTRKYFFHSSHSKHQVDDRVLEKGSERLERREARESEVMAKARLALRGFQTLVGWGDETDQTPKLSRCTATGYD